MYNELINVSSDGNVFLQDDSIALMPCLWKVYKKKGMGSNMVKWVVAVYDYKSPYRRFPIEERKRQVSYSIFSKYKCPHEDKEIVLDAINEYIRFQYDPLIDQYNAMGEQAFNVTAEFRKIKVTKKNIDEINDMQKKMAVSAKSREEIKVLILKDQESEAKIQGTGSDDFSMFEQDERLGR